MIVVVSSDLLVVSRIASLAEAAGADWIRVDSPSEMPEPDALLRAYVDWGARQAEWGRVLSDWAQRAIQKKAPPPTLFGPHTDLAAHREARVLGIGPMVGRSKLFATVSSRLA